MMDKRNDLLLHVNRCSRIFESSSKHSSSVCLAEELLEKYYEDQFVNYSIAGALKIFIINCKSEDDFKSFLLLLVNRLKTEKVYWMMIRILMCLNGVLSSRIKTNMIPNNTDILIDIISQNWNDITCNLLDTELECRKLQQNDIYPFEFVRLWKKIVKLVIKSGKPNKFSILEEMSMVNDKIWNLMLNSENPLFYKYILKLFNCLLPFGDLIHNGNLNIHPVFIKTARHILSFFHQKGFNSIPMRFNCGGFIGVSMATELSVDMIQLRLMTMLALKSTAIVVEHSDYIERGISFIEDCMHCLDNLSAFVVSSCKFPDYEKKLKDYDNWVLEMFADQDDMWIESLLALLDIHNKIYQIREFSSLQEHPQALTNPHQHFILFMKATDFDDSVLIDLLTSPETCFLLYFTRYLKCLKKEWTSFLLTARHFTMNKISVNTPSEDNIHTVDEARSQVCDRDFEGDTHSMTGGIYPPSSGLTLLGLYESDSDCEENNSHVLKSNHPVDIDNKRIIYPGSDRIFGKDSNATRSDIDINYEVTSLKTETGQTLSVEICCNKPKKEKYCDGNFKVMTEMCVEKYTNSNKQKLDKYLKDTSKYQKEKRENITSANVKLVDDVISCIIRLRMKISKLWKADLFPYNPEPLIRSIMKVEDLYEN